MKLVLVRYGEYENGHLTEQGKETMIKASDLLKILVKNKKTCVVSASIPRAIESSKVISENLKISSVKIFDEFYAAEEAGIKVDIDKAKNILDLLSREFEVVIAIISREYIEKLSGKSLQRGEIFLLDYK